ncbi:MAG TPA: sigma-70 family RNA polymerase sigma factor [Thermoanaerobaculia bacterium]|nr:sigma-70 family RNA polymerase sigma factor [Thermoanaerobaculia bacterium]
MIQESLSTKTRFDDILARPSSLWTPEEKGDLLDFVLCQDPYALASCAESTFFKKGSGIPLEYGKESFNLFLSSLDKLLDKYDPKRGKLKNYLRVSLVTHCEERIARFWRKKRRGPTIVPLEVEDASMIDLTIEGNPYQRLAQRELHRAMEVLVPQALSELPVLYSEALMLFLEDKSYKVIAKELGVSLAVVKNRICRARQLLRPKLAVLKSSYGL